MSAVADTSQRRRAEEALRKTSETLQALVQASPVGIAILDPDGRVEMWNPAEERIFGWSADEVLGRSLPTIPDGKEEEHSALRERVLKGGASSAVELQRRAKDGSLLDISLSAAPLRGLDGNISGIVGMMADITERKRGEEAEGVGGVALNHSEQHRRCRHRHRHHRTCGLLEPRRPVAHRLEPGRGR